MNLRPTTLTRYVLREVLVPLFATIALTIFGAATSQLIRMANEVSGLGMSLGDLLMALPYALPTFLGIGLPIAYFLSLLVGFGRMAEDRELGAMAASGISTRRLLALPLGLGVLLCIIGWVMTLWAEPYAIRRLRQQLVDSAADYFGRTLAAGVIHDYLRDVTIYFGGRDNESRELYQVLIADERQPDKPRLMLARSGVIDKGAGTRLTFSLKNGELHEGSARDAAYRRVSFERMELEIDTGDFVGRTVSQLPAMNNLTLSELLLRIDDPAQGIDVRNNATITLHRKIAFPVANLIFVMLVFPVTTLLSRQSRLKAYVFSAINVAIYFTMAQATDSLMNRFSLGPVAATWAPTLLFGGIGMMLVIWRLRR